MGNSEGPLPVPKKEKEEQKKATEESSECPAREVIKFDSKKSVENIEYTQLQLQIREAEIDHLITEVSHNNLVSKIFGLTKK